MGYPIDGAGGEFPMYVGINRRRETDRCRERGVPHVRGD